MNGTLTNVTYNNTQPPLAVGVQNHTVTGGEVLEGQYLGACGVASISVTGAVAVGDLLYWGPSTADQKYAVKATIANADSTYAHWIIGQALQAVANGGTIKVSTCVPRKA